MGAERATRLVAARPVVDMVGLCIVFPFLRNVHGDSEPIFVVDGIVIHKYHRDRCAASARSLLYGRDGRESICRPLRMLVVLVERRDRLRAPSVILAFSEAVNVRRRSQRRRDAGSRGSCNGQQVLTSESAPSRSRGASITIRIRRRGLAFPGGIATPPEVLSSPAALASPTDRAIATHREAGLTDVG